MSQAKLPTLFKCVKCGKEYNKRSSFQSHMETHNDKLYACDKCEKKYKLRGVLLEHKRTAHAEAGPLKSATNKFIPSRSPSAQFAAGKYVMDNYPVTCKLMQGKPVNATCAGRVIEIQRH
ncbi:zinc finger protein [Aphelenchoides avenae]|nr:zinc finger protein [Aphelenchus avenae]